MSAPGGPACRIPSSQVTWVLCPSHCDSARARPAIRHSCRLSESPRSQPKSWPNPRPNQPQTICPSWTTLFFSVSIEGFGPRLCIILRCSAKTNHAIFAIICTCQFLDLNYLNFAHLTFIILCWIFMLVLISNKAIKTKLK
jgi:hypothetical protein